MEEKSVIGHFELSQSDGVHGAQVLVYTPDDLMYWVDQCKKTGHLMALNYHVPENAMGYPDPAHDVYQILPSELIHYFIKWGKAPLGYEFLVLRKSV